MRRMIKAGKEKFMPIVTGHQGEPGSVLSRIATDDTPYKIDKGDKILFSARVIPNPMNFGQRYMVETRLKMKGARIFEDLHVSGHAQREDHYELLHLLDPQHVIPSHGGLNLTGSYVGFAEEIGYKFGNDLHILRNGQRVQVAK
jgi:ribonuclease J